MSNARAGYNAIALFSTSTGGAVTKIGELRDYSIRAGHAPINATSHDSSGDRELVAGTGQWGGNASVMFLSTEAEHQEAFDVLVARTRVDAEFYPTGSSSEGVFSGQIFMTDFEMSAPNEDAVAANISFEGDGALSRA